MYLLVHTRLPEISYFSLVRTGLFIYTILESGSSFFLDFEAAVSCPSWKDTLESNPKGYRGDPAPLGGPGGGGGADVSYSSAAFHEQQHLNFEKSSDCLQCFSAWFLKLRIPPSRPSESSGFDTVSGSNLVTTFAAELGCDSMQDGINKQCSCLNEAG